MNHAITTAGRAGRIDDAMTIFRSIPKAGYTTDLMSYNNIIWSAGHARRVDQAKKLFQELAGAQQTTNYARRISSSVDVPAPAATVTFRNGAAAATAVAVGSIGSVGSPTPRDNVAGPGYLRPNVYTYGALMHGFAKTRSYKQVGKCFIFPFLPLLHLCTLKNCKEWPTHTPYVYYDQM